MLRKSLDSYDLGSAEKALPASLRSAAMVSAAPLGFDAPAKAIRTMRVGFIGLDHTGEAMASRLLNAGHRLTVYDPTREIPEAVASAGASIADSIELACRWADAVFTMLPNDEVAEAVILGSGGVVESLPRTAIHIGSSTVSVECSDRIVEAHWDAGKQYVSAPVLVRSGPTAEEQLHVIAGGRESTIIEIDPILRPIGRLIRLSGWPSDANFIQLGADREDTTLRQFIARHPELSARPAPPFVGFDLEIKGVFQ